MSFPVSRLCLLCFFSPLCARHPLLNFSFHLEMSPFYMHRLRSVCLSITSMVLTQAWNALSYSPFTPEAYTLEILSCMFAQGLGSEGDYQ